MQTKVLRLLNRVDATATESQHASSQDTKGEIRRLRLESLHMRMAAYRRAGMYEQALADAISLWQMMSQSERRANASFGQTQIKELYLLAKASKAA